MNKYQNIILAGTFDRLHAGHLQLINQAKKSAEKISCFITTDKFINTTSKPLKNLIQPYNVRLAEVKKLLPKLTDFYPLNDPFGPADKSTEIEAILATPETEKNVELINYKRQKNNLSPLAVVKVDLKKDQLGNVISSEKIRLGKINRHGLVYSQVLNNKTLVLPEKNRSYFKKPLGHLHASIPPYLHASIPLIITVGDVATQNFLKTKLKPNLCVFDCRVKRQPVVCPVKQPNLIVKNPAGQISSDLIRTLIKLFNKPFEIKNYFLKINGEEDLAVLPIILLSPLSTQIFYGQPSQGLPSESEGLPSESEGLVQVKVTEEKKAQTLNLLKKFNQLN